MAVMPLPIPSCVYFLLFRMLFIVQPIRKAQVPSFLTEHGESFSVCCIDLHFQDFFVKIHKPVKVFHNKIDRTGSRFISFVLQKSNAKKRFFIFRCCPIRPRRAGIPSRGSHRGSAPPPRCAARAAAPPGRSPWRRDREPHPAHPADAPCPA